MNDSQGLQKGEVTDADVRRAIVRMTQVDPANHEAIHVHDPSPVTGNKGMWCMPNGVNGYWHVLGQNRHGQPILDIVIIATEEIPTEEIQWALTEDVAVTLISYEPASTRATYLVTRNGYDRRGWNDPKPWDQALVLVFEDDTVEINGQPMLDHSQLEEWCSLVDAVSLSPHFPTGGDYVTTRVRDE